MPAIDLNADMGEYANTLQRENETALMPLLTSCSIACCGHAGNTESMRATAMLAKKHGVRVGAHPSYPDRAGFGRRSRSYAHDELHESLIAQIKQLKGVLAAESMRLTHIKPHGALYNDAAKDAALARLIASVSSGAVLVGPPNSELEITAQKAGLSFAREGFVDRLYLSNGALSPRTEPGAVLASTEARAQQALAIATGNTFSTADGELTIETDTLCIHSDSPGAVETAMAVRAALSKAAISIRSFV
ncbi:5-oxoprolinase subunit PxpA [Hyphococcus sp.]|uniref:5-oxoprolinase subunit PxpA n=1 Tax=Hyphococcus sp. TaxID=2038636 RepID=UPI002080116D|nr:MAG: UPF0271 protein [Marinicaulis sp.]